MAQLSASIKIGMLCMPIDQELDEHAWFVIYKTSGPHVTLHIKPNQHTLVTSHPLSARTTQHIHPTPHTPELLITIPIFVFYLTITLICQSLWLLSDHRVTES